MILLDSLFRRLIRSGRLRVIWPNGRDTIYRGVGPSGRRSSIRLHDRAICWRLISNPILAAGEGYMDGRITIEDGGILDLLDLIMFNIRWEHDNPAREVLHGRKGLLAKLREYNGRWRARRNVTHHYDLSDRLYQLFLDEDRQYSCAYFSDPATDLDVAQTDKKAHLAAKLLLEPGQRVLDIGCGWGGLALYLHQVADVDVLGVTLSQEQLAVAERRAREAGVEDRVRFELRDFRDLDGAFDRIISVGMFEHVGRPNYRAFFKAIGDLLTDDGVALVHSIGRADGPGETDAWTRKYIFPGGYSPALSEIMPVIERSGLWTTDIEILRLHYAYTLERWYARTEAGQKAIEDLYDERFFRMWSFYLVGAMMAFRYGGHCNFQIQLAHRRDSVPLTRSYIEETERRFRITGAPRAVAAE